VKKKNIRVVRWHSGQVCGGDVVWVKVFVEVVVVVKVVCCLGESLCGSGGGGGEDGDVVW